MDELLLKYIQGEISQEEKMTVIHWLDERPENMRKYLSMRKLYNISLWSDNKSSNRARLNFKRIAWNLLKYVAVLIIAFSCVMFYLHTKDKSPDMQTIIVPSGQRVEVILADGTKVWLNSLSTFRFPEHFSNGVRKVELDGEGYFKVTQNAKAPFVVKTYQYDVKVLGTEFNLKAYRERDFFETALIKGRVAIEALDKNEIMTMKPNERVIYMDGALQVYPIGDLDYFRWRDGLFCFTNETIGSLIQKLELYYDVKIRMERADLTNYTYSGKFRIKDGIEHVLKVLQLNHQFDYLFDEEKNEIIII